MTPSGAASNTAILGDADTLHHGPAWGWALWSATDAIERLPMARDQHTETECKYHVPPDAKVPELTDLPRVDQDRARRVELDATYFDTADLARHLLT